MIIEQINKKTPLQLSYQEVKRHNTYYVVEQFNKLLQKYSQRPKDNKRAFSICQSIYLDGIFYQKAIEEKQKDKFKYCSNSIWKVLFINKITQFTIENGKSIRIETNDFERFLKDDYYLQLLFKEGMKDYFKTDFHNPILTYEVTKDDNMEFV